MARRYVNAREPFTNKNGSLYGYWDTYAKIYAVFSYGRHFPIYVWSEGRWFGNEDKWSRTTSRHQLLARPDGEIIFVETERLKRIVVLGPTRVLVERMAK